MDYLRCVNNKTLHTDLEIQIFIVFIFFSCGATTKQKSTRPRGRTRTDDVSYGRDEAGIATTSLSITSQFYKQWLSINRYLLRSITSQTPDTTNL